MIITSKKQVIYNIEFTDVQINDIQEYLIASQTNDSAFTACQELYGSDRTDEIRETLVNLLMTLENR